MRQGEQQAFGRSVLLATFVLLAWDAVHPVEASSARAGAERNEPSRALVSKAQERLAAHDAPGAMQLLERASTMAQAASDRKVLATIRLAEAEAAFALARWDDARAFAEQALREAKLCTDREQEGWALDTLGNAHFYLEEYQKALEAFEASRRLMTAVDNRYGQAMATKDAGITFKYLGAFDKALEYLEPLPSLFEELGKRAEAASVLENIGMAYETLGDRERALVLYRQALMTWRELEDARGIQGALTRIGNIYVDAGDAELAAKCYSEALEVSSEPISDRSWILAGLSDALAGQGKLDEAIEARRRAIELDRRTHSYVGAANNLRAMAELILSRDPSKAFRPLREALDLYQRHSARLAWNGYSGFARAYYHIGDFDRAVDNYEQAISRLESARRRLPSEEQKVSLIDSYQSVYEGAMEALIARFRENPQKGDDVHAFEMLERARARTMAETIAATGAAAGPESTQSGWGEGAKPLTLRETQALLEPATALLAYFLTKDQTIVFVVSRTTFRSRSLHLPGNEITERVRNYVELLSRGVETADWSPVSRRLYRDLVAPVRGDLPEAVSQLVIIPDGILNFLPFETLIGADMSLGTGTAVSKDPPYLLRDFTVSYVPSASVLAGLRERLRENRDHDADLVAFADPACTAGVRKARGFARALYEEDRGTFGPIPYSAVEARAIAQYAGRGSEILSGTEAGEDRLDSRWLDRFRILHFATHGIISERRPGMAALVLAPGRGAGADGLLLASEIYSLKLTSDLVVMSSCRTARGRIAAGEGVQGLARAFFHAGAPTVVASLWTVDDRATASLMTAFYRHLAGGMSKAGALRAAKMDCIERAPSGTPRLWAPFVILGEGNATVPISGLPWWRRHRWLIAGLSLVAALAIVATPRKHATRRR